jgi:hypothetical protein
MTPVPGNFTVTVGPDGKAVFTPTELPPHPIFDAFNAWAFGGELERVPVSVRDIAVAYYNRSDGIVLKDGDPEQTCTLLHEMVHVALHQQGHEDWVSGVLEPHGANFRAECDRISALLGGWHTFEYADLFEDDYRFWPAPGEFCELEEDIMRAAGLGG